MPKKKVKPFKKAQPDQYVPVNRSSKPHYRRGRGTVTPARLNDVLQTQAEAVKVAMPAAKRMLDALENQLADMKRGALQATIGLRIAKEIRQQGYPDYHTLPGLQAHKDAPLEDLLKGMHRVEIIEHDKEAPSIRINVGLHREAIRVRSTLITGFQLCGVLLAGDATDTEIPLEVREVCSEVYPVRVETDLCVLELPLPENEGIPWVLWLRISCMESGREASSSMYRRMKIVACGKT